MSAADSHRGEVLARSAADRFPTPPHGPELGTLDATLASDDDLAAAWHTLTVRYHRLQCEIDRVLQTKHQISGSEFEVLELLSGVDSCKLRMSELSGQVHLSQSALSRLVAGLEKDGLAERTMCDYDRRSVFAALTPAGEAKYAAARPTHREILRNEVACGSGLCGTQTAAEVSRETPADTVAPARV